MTVKTDRSETKKLRVGFLLDSLNSNRYTAELIEFIHKNDVFDAPTLITGYKREKSLSKSQKILKKFRKQPIGISGLFLKYFLRIFIQVIETKSVKKRFPKYRTNEFIKIEDGYNVLDIKGSWSKSGLFLELTEEDLTLVSKCNLDCIIRCGSGILKGEILDITKFGVISFHHGDNRVNRGGPSGFWEVVGGEPSSGFIIQKLNKELDGGEVLFRGNLMTKDTWQSNNAQLLEKSNIFMMRLLKELAYTRKLPYEEGVRLHGNKLYKIETGMEFIKYFIKILIPKIFNSLVSKLITPKVSRWSVAYSFHNNFSKSLWRYKEISNPKGRFLADPFIMENNGENYIFVEDFHYKDNKGRISALKVDEEKYDFLDIVVEEDFHLSFPFVFKDGANIYMVPESCENSDIRLYQSVDFPYEWEFKQKLMVDVDAADTMLIKQNETWFMFTNICSAGIGDHQSELHIFYSDVLETNNWIPIESGNPVIFDPLKGRNGGMFVHKEKIYRVNQVHGKGHYGRGFSINEIIRISKDKFVEKEVSLIEPNFKDSIMSTHHFSANHSLATIDFARFERKRIALRN